MCVIERIGTGDCCADWAVENRPILVQFSSISRSRERQLRGENNPQTPDMQSGEEDFSAPPPERPWRSFTLPGDRRGQA
jgi:hypothetical protein